MALRSKRCYVFWHRKHSTEC